MSRQYMVTEYDADDIEKLDSMSKDEVIATLEHIERGWLPQDYVFVPDNPARRAMATYTESQYDATKLHKAIHKAIEMLNSIKQEED